MKSFAVVLGFNKPSVVAAAISRYHELTCPLADELIVVNCQYPGQDEGFYDELAKTVSVLTLPENKGVIGNYNQVFEALRTRYKAQDDDVFAFFDPDSSPSPKTWLKAACEVLAATGAGYVSLSRKTPDLIQPLPAINASGHNARPLTVACGWPMGIWSAKFARLGHPFKAVDGNGVEHPFYGFTENDMLNKFAQTGMPGYMLMDVVDQGYEDPAIQGLFDPAYVAWKVASAHKQTMLSFSDWLNAQRQ